MRPTGLARAVALAVVAWMSAASAREVLTPEEQAERDLEAKRQAPPALAVQPTSLRARMKPGEAVALTLTVRNAGGRRLVWSVLSAPKWARLDTLSGELGFGEERQLVIVIEPDKIEPGKPPEGVITIIAPGTRGSPAKVPVRVILLGPPTLPEPREEPVAERTEREPDDAAARAGPRRGKPTVAGEKKRGSFGLRAGVVLPSPGESQDYGTNPILGVSYRIGRNGSSRGPRPRVVYEIGLDIGMPEEVDLYTSVPVRARFDTVFGSGSVYILAGGAGLVEFVTDTLTDESYANYAGALDLGAGLLFAGGRADIRLAYEVLLGSDNLGGQTVVSFGYRF